MGCDGCSHKRMHDNIIDVSLTFDIEHYRSTYYPKLNLLLWVRYRPLFHTKRFSSLILSCNLKTIDTAVNGRLLVEMQNIQHIWRKSCINDQIYCVSSLMTKSKYRKQRQNESSPRLSRRSWGECLLRVTKTSFRIYFCAS